MFKLVKILGGSTNTPDAIKMTYGTGDTFYRGEAITFTDCGAQHCEEDVVPTYIAIKTDDQTPDQIYCYRITPNMVFRTKLPFEALTMYEGQKLCLHVDKNGHAISVAPDSEPSVCNATVYRIYGLEKGSEVDITFN